MLSFYGDAFEEVSARGDVVEQIFDGDAGAHRRGVYPLFQHFTAFDAYVLRHFVFGPARFHFYLGHRGDRRHRFAPKPISIQSKQILRFLNLGGCMPLPTQAHIGFAHPLAIVDHLHQCAAPVFHQQGDFVGTGIQTIL